MDGSANGSGYTRRGWAGSVTTAEDGLREDTGAPPRISDRPVPQPRHGTHAGKGGRSWPERGAARPSFTAADDHPSEYQDEQRRARGPITGPQRAGAILLAAAAIVGAVWYVPKIATADSHSFTGTISSTGITDLNFASSGRVGRILVHLGQKVNARQVLATESATSTVVLSADWAAITADMASMAQLRAESGVANVRASLAAAAAKLAKGRARLASDQAKLVGAEIVAPFAGTVVAINGQVGETVSSGGVRNYSSQTAQSSPQQQPAFSLLPEGPRSIITGNATQSALPMIALRSAGSWVVNFLVPESAVASIRPGQRAIVSVPAVNRSNVPGRVEGVSPTPVNTSRGVAYQVSISVEKMHGVMPFSGMTANVELIP